MVKKIMEIHIHILELVVGSGEKETTCEIIWRAKNNVLFITCKQLILNSVLWIYRFLMISFFSMTYLEVLE
jgi:hypothetical protein